MCRFALYLGSPIRIGSLVTEPAHSLIRQSYQSREREEPLNGDGFGVAWYVPDESPNPAVFKDLTPAWSNPNLVDLARVTRTPCLLAHIRAATPGLPVTRLNCHPFTSAQFAFMHNGLIPDFRRVIRPLQRDLTDDAFHQITGSTDSEHIFALFTDAWTRSAETDPLDRMSAALLSSIARVEELRRELRIEEDATLNLVVADGRRAVVSRYRSPGTEQPNSLYVHAGREYVCDDGVSRMVPADGSGGAVIVASEPLSLDPGWERVEPNHLVLIADDLRVAQRPIVF